MNRRHPFSLDGMSTGLSPGGTVADSSAGQQREPCRSTSSSNAECVARTELAHQDERCPVDEAHFGDGWRTRVQWRRVDGALVDPRDVEERQDVVEQCPGRVHVGRVLHQGGDLGDDTGCGPHANGSSTDDGGAPTTRSRPSRGWRHPHRVRHIAEVSTKTAGVMREGVDERRRRARRRAPSTFGEPDLYAPIARARSRS